MTDVVGVPTSSAAAAEAVACRIPLVTFDEVARLDLTIDGADEVSPAADLVKGGGGAHLREKIVAQASDRLVIVVDEAKLVSALGSSFRVPVEVIRLARRLEQDYLERLGARVRLRESDGEPFVTDEGNWILDVDFGPISDPGVLLRTLQQRAGIVEVGLFVGMNPTVLVAGPPGMIRALCGTPEAPSGALHQLGLAAPSVVSLEA